MKTIKYVFLVVMLACYPSIKCPAQADLFLAPGYAAMDQLISIYAIRKRSPDEVFPLSHDLKEVSVSKSETEETYALLIPFSGRRPCGRLPLKHSDQEFFVLQA